jgi:hypothetical protein
MARGLWSCKKKVQDKKGGMVTHENKPDEGQGQIDKASYKSELLLKTIVELTRAQDTLLGFRNYSFIIFLAVGITVIINYSLFESNMMMLIFLGIISVGSAINGVLLQVEYFAKMRDLSRFVGEHEESEQSIRDLYKAERLRTRGRNY